MRLLIQTLLILTLTVGVSACTGRGGEFDLRKPYALDLEPPPGPPEYRQGWTDGCESGMNAYSGPVYKLAKVFKYYQDPVLRNNKMYYQVWKDAYFFCAVFLEGKGDPV